MGARMVVALYKPAGQALFLRGVKIGFAARVGYNPVTVEETHRPACAALRPTKDCM